MLLMLLTTPALADGFGSAKLVDGAPVDQDFVDCLDADGCRQAFLQFLSASILEQGFTMQGLSLSASPLAHDREGLVVGGSLASFPLGAPATNLSGKEENTQFSPVFPRINVGHLSQDEDRRVAVGGSFLPPIPVGGAAALELGVEAGVVFAGAGESGLGIESEFTFIRANAPITATEEQLDERDDFSNPDNLSPDRYEDVCGTDGCLDTFTMANLELRGGYGWAIQDFRPYARLGVTVVNEWLYVMYDDTTWSLFSLQPAAHVGSGWQPGDSIHLGLGASAALQQANQSESSSIGVFYTFEGAASWVF
ncbi:MAG: hypothetical protein P8R54_27980 [Myxococcota bacterium]|nr:hypothetical protein [Myxococcota bacterium]